MNTTTTITPEHSAAATAANAQVTTALASAEASKALALSVPPWERAPIFDATSKMLKATLAHADSIGFHEGDELPGMDVEAYARARDLSIELSNAAFEASTPQPFRLVRKGR